jgi:hypothetical protein
MEDLTFALSTLVIIGRVVVDETAHRQLRLRVELYTAKQRRRSRRQRRRSFDLHRRAGTTRIRLDPHQEPAEFFVIEHLKRPSGN